MTFLFFYTAKITIHHPSVYYKTGFTISLRYSEAGSCVLYREYGLNDG